MTSVSASARYNPVFNDFLYAHVADGATGTPVSLLSALARLGVDPWMEAAQLSKLPLESATQRLAALIGRLPAATLAPDDAGPVAVRLIKLLPHGSSAEAPDTLMRRAAKDQSGISQLKLAVALAIGIYLLAIAGQWAFFSPSSRVDAPAVTTPVSPLPRW